MAESFDRWAVVVFRADDRWQVEMLPRAVSADLEDVVEVVRGQLPGAFALVDVADEFFVVVRHLAGQELLLLSDVTASATWELAAQVMDRLELDPPGEDELDELWPAGDLAVFDDLGLDAMELGAILSDVDAYADEMLSTLARRLGFSDAFERAVDALV
ncbi:MAG: tRNA adenosine deaminase-associated protein [Mycobacteriales bacterium]